MTNENLFSIKKVDELRPHLKSIFRKELQSEYDSFLKSEEFLKEKEKVRGEEYPLELISDADKAKNILTEILNDSKEIILKTKNVRVIQSIFNHYLYVERLWKFDNFLYSNEIQEFLEIGDLDYDSYTKNILLAFSNYTEKKLDQHLVGHAIMNFNLTNSPTVSAMEELEALIQTTAVCSLSELEDKVKSHFDFSKEIKRGNEDIEHSWRF